MKLKQIALLMLTITLSFMSNAQESSAKKSTKDAKLRDVEVKEVQKLSLTPEQTADNKTKALKEKVQLSESQEVAVKDLFLKMENRRVALNKLNEQERAKALKDVKTVEDRELNTILSNQSTKKQTESPSKTKTATNM